MAAAEGGGRGGKGREAGGRLDARFVGTLQREVQAALRRRGDEPRGDFGVRRNESRGALAAFVLSRVLFVLLELKGELLLPLVELAQRILLDVALDAARRAQALPCRQVASHLAVL